MGGELLGLRRQAQLEAGEVGGQRPEDGDVILAVNAFAALGSSTDQAKRLTT